MDQGLLMGALPVEILLDMVMPYKVYEVLSETSPDCRGPLMMIKAAFEEEADANDFIERKASATGKKYIIKSKRAEVEE